MRWIGTLLRDVFGVSAPPPQPPGFVEFVIDTARKIADCHTSTLTKSGIFNVQMSDPNYVLYWLKREGTALANSTKSLNGAPVETTEEGIIRFCQEQRREFFIPEVKEVRPSSGHATEINPANIDRDLNIVGILSKPALALTRH